MSSGDKHLDAEWKRIQKKTFSRWCNEHLKVQKLSMEDLTSDLSDGVRLIVLIEVLANKKVGRYNKKPRVYAQKMENVQLALDFLMKKERIRLVNIGECLQQQHWYMHWYMHAVAWAGRASGRCSRSLGVLGSPTTGGLGDAVPAGRGGGCRERRCLQGEAVPAGRGGACRGRDHQQQLLQQLDAKLRAE